MKKQKAILLFFASLLSFTSAQAQRLTVTKSTVDVGRTGYEQPVTATFELRNRGLRRLVIQNVIPDCSCTTVEYPKGEIGMGDHFTIKMTYDARMLGHFNKQAAVVSNASKTPVYLTMTGIVLEDMKDYSGSYPFDLGGLLADKNELEFDDVNKGQMLTAVVGIMNNTNKPMQPNVLHLPPYLSAVVIPERLMPGRSGQVTFTLTSDQVRDYGLTQTSVYLAQQLGEKVKSETEIGVSTVLLPDMKGVGGANAPMLALSDSVLTMAFEGKAKRNGVITLTNNGRTTLDISSLQMFTSGLKVTLDKRAIKPGESAKLKVTAYAEQIAKARTKPRVLMITNDPKHAKVIITLEVKN